jgi:hypothetical protein
LANFVENRDLQHQIKCHKDDGSIRLSEQEKTIKILSGKSDLHKRIANLSAEVATLKTAEQKLMMDLQFYQEKAAKAAEAAKFAEDKLAAIQSHLHAPNQRRSKSELLVATMSEQIEKQAEEIQRLEMLLKAAKDEYDRQCSELSSAHQRHEEQASGLRLLADTHEKKVTELSTEVLRLEEAIQLRTTMCEKASTDLRQSESVRLAAEKLAENLRDKLLRAEELIVQTKASVADQVHALTTKQACALTEAEQASSESQRLLLQSQLECDQILTRLAQKEEELLQLGKEAHRLETALRTAECEVREAEGRVRQAQDLAQRENERLQINLSSASGQLTVLMETIEALQSSGKAEQQVAGLAAKISSAKVNIKTNHDKHVLNIFITKSWIWLRRRSNSKCS